MNFASARPLSTSHNLFCGPPSPAGPSQCNTHETPNTNRHVNNNFFKGLPRGLVTPPFDGNMGTTYEMPPHLPSCENFPLVHPSYYPSSTISQSDRRRPALNERPVPNEQYLNPASRCPSQLPPQTQTQRSTQPKPLSGYRPTPPSSSFVLAASSVASTSAPDQSQQIRSGRPPHPPTPAVGTSPAESTASAKMTNHSMNIPDRISAKGGSIADFMADVAALFWFESAKLLERVERMQSVGPGTSVQPLAPTAIASQHFKKWVSSVLSTTQVTQNVVILALLYIYRLKKANPTVKGRPGSEYRLLTVALMLGNKFLDDNTYTNKTWADVSGISVNEIHVMEVEFLSNMRYSLLVSAEQWEQWLDKLAKFWSYLELAQHAASPTPSPLVIPSPAYQNAVSPAHSPTVPLTPGLQSTTHSFTLQSPNLAPMTTGQNWPATYVASNAASPLASKQEAVPCRKRSYPEDDATAQPAKRVNRAPAPAERFASQAAPQYAPPSTSQQAQYAQAGFATAAPVQPRPLSSMDQARPQVPSLTLNTAQAVNVPVTQAQPCPTSNYAPQQAPLTLPPLASGIRAMAMVYPTTTYASSTSVPATCGTVTPTTSFPSMNYGTPTKRLSPQNALAAYPGSSPLVMGTPMGNGSTSGLHTPISHSPSIYLQQRNSPYKPVRHVNTLLYPPPAAFLQQYNLPNPVLPNQMHYQPLGKRNEYRTGIVPEFLNGVHRSVPYQHQSVAQMLPVPHPQAQQPRGHYQLPSAARPGPSYTGQY